MTVWKTIDGWAIIYRGKGLGGTNNIVEVYDVESDAKKFWLEKIREFERVTSTKINKDEYNYFFKIIKTKITIREKKKK